MEVLVGALIVTILVAAGAAAPGSIASSISQAQDRWQAIDLGASQIEDLKELSRTGFSATTGALAAGVGKSSTANITVPTGFTITYTIVDKFDWPEDGVFPVDTTVDYKDATVTCAYGSAGKTVLLRTYLIKG